jgi:hypothetical protein
MRWAQVEEPRVRGHLEGLFRKTKERRIQS